MSKTISKTVRFDPITFLKVRKAADDLGVCTSVFIREIVSSRVALVEVGDYS